MAKKKAKRTVEKKSVAKKSAAKPARKQKSIGLAIVALILNLLLPGIGSLIGGRIKIGIMQLILIIISLVLSLFYTWISLLIWFIAWIWAIVTGIILVKRAS